MEKQKKVLAIHDISCAGRCSLTVALPILSVAGFDTRVLPTAVLSTHTGGFEGYTYRDLTSDIVPITDHWQTLNIQFDALYSGFLGSFEQIELVADIFEKFKSDGTIILVDPVMGDNGKLYKTYTPEMARDMGKLCSLADVVVPNLTEAAFLLGEDFVGEDYTKEYIEETMKKLSKMGAKKVVITGVSFGEGELGAATYDSQTGEISYAFCERVMGYFHGTGDIFGSTLLSALMCGFSLPEGAQIAVDYVEKCIELTVQMDLEKRYGVCFERALPYLIKRLNIE